MDPGPTAGRPVHRELVRRLVQMYAPAVLASIPLASNQAQPQPPRATLREDLRLSATAEDFPRVRAISVSPQGKIVVPIVTDMQLRIYDATGRKRTVVGRRGDGPGEFREMATTGWKGDTLWINDNTQRRLTYIAPNDSVVRVETHERFDAGPTAAMRKQNEYALSTISVAAVLPDGDVLGFSIPLPKDQSEAQRAFGGDAHMIRVGRDRKPLVLAQLPWSGDAKWSMSAGGYGKSVPFAFMPQTVVSATGDRFAHLWSELTSSSAGTFTITAIRADGDTIFVRTFPFTGTRVSNFSRDSALEALVMRTAATETEAGVNAEFQKIARVRMSNVYPAVEFLLLGLDRTTWIGLRPTEKGQPVLVLNARGDPVASILVPLGSRLRQATAATAYMSETDSDGLVSVVRYRIFGISCGLGGC